MRAWFLLALLCLLTLPARAQDINAYQVPENTSYVRVMNFSKDTVEGYKLNGESIEALPSQKIGKYYPVKGYSAKLHYQDLVTEKDMVPGRFYSFVQMDGPRKFLFLEEDKLLNPAKAFIHFYNLSDRKTLDLKLNGGKVLVTYANQGKVGSNDINADPVTLGVYANRSLVAEVPDVKLKSGQATTIVVIGAGKGLKVIVN